MKGYYLKMEHIMKTNKALVLIILLVGLTKLTYAQVSVNDITDKSDSYESSLSINTNQGASIENVFQFDDYPIPVITTKRVLILFLIFIIGVFLGGWSVFYFSKRKIYSILENEKAYYLDYRPLKTEKSIFRYITLFHVLKKRKDSCKRHNLELRAQMEELENKNKELINQMKIPFG